MQQNDYNDFCSTLIGCFSAVGRGKPDTATAGVFWMKLIQYDLPAVKWARVECTDVDHGYQYNVKLIKKTIESKLRISKFREQAELAIKNQEKKTIEQAIYIESDEFKKNQQAAELCFESIRKELNENV